MLVYGPSSICNDGLYVQNAVTLTYDSKHMKDEMKLFIGPKKKKKKKADHTDTFD